MKELSREEIASRNRDIALLRGEGHTYRIIAERYGITPERVREIVQAFNRKRDKRILPVPDVDMPDAIRFDDMNLSVRVQNVLKNADIQTVGDLRRTSKESLLKAENFGSKSLAEIECLWPENYMSRRDTRKLSGAMIGL